MTTSIERLSRPTLSRRRFAMAVAGTAATALNVRFGHAQEMPVGTPVVAVPGYDDTGRWAGRGLRVAAWGGEVQTMLRDVLWSSFAKATGCEIKEYTSDYGELRRGVEQGDPYVDLLIVDPMFAVRAAAGIAELIPDAQFDRSSIGPVATTAVSVPAYAYGLVGAYRRDTALRVGEPRSWAAWWDTALYGGRRGLARTAFGNFEFALLADGVAPADLYPLDGARAIERLKEVSGKILDRWWDSGEQPVAWLGRKRVDYASAWHYRVQAGKLDGRAVEWVWEQGLLIADHWLIPRGAPGRDVALDFLRFASTAEAQAAMAAAMPLGPINPAAFDLLEPRSARITPTAPENVSLMIPLNADWWAANDAEANERFNTWLLGLPMYGEE